MLAAREFVRAINAIEPERTHRSLIIFGPPSTQINEFYAVKWKLKMFLLSIVPGDIGATPEVDQWENSNCAEKATRCYAKQTMFGE